MKPKFENIVRSFGMTCYQINAELDSIGKSYDLELGHLPAKPDAKETDYYPQFEQQLRSEASEMAGHYEVFYCLEKAIRKLITEAMEEAAGEQWWDGNLVNPEIQKEVSNRIQREIDSGVSRRSLEKLDYTTFGELSVLITSNWNVFGAIFNSRKNVERVMSNLNTIRAPIAHCSKLPEDEVLRLRLAVRDWFRAMQ